jgi:4-hydroxy-3-polyprenylbenzoate decarboxylase
MKIIVGISGASGAIFGIRTLQALTLLNIETHLVISRWARATIAHETSFTVEQVESLATVVHPSENQAAPVSSGSFKNDGMIVAPCSAKSLAAIRTGYSDNLLTRAADVTLKERRKLVLLVRESPLSEIHLENMLCQHSIIIRTPSTTWCTTSSAARSISLAWNCRGCRGGPVYSCRKLLRVNGLRASFSPGVSDCF